MLYRHFLLTRFLLLSAVLLCGAERDRLTFYYNIAEGNYLIGDQSGAERGIEQSLRLDPTHAPSLALKAKILLDQSQPEAALQAAEQTIESAPDELEYQILKALILGNLDRHAEAIALINAILEKKEASNQEVRTTRQLKGRLKLTRAKLLAQGGQADEAILSLQQLVGQNPDNLEATVTLASIYASQEEWLALEDLIAPIAKNPLLTDVALYLEGRAALARDRVGTARAKFEEALQQNAERPTALQNALEFYRSICFEKLGRFAQAEQCLENAMAGGYTPETPAEAVHLGRILLRRDEVETLIPILEKALLRDNASPQGWALLGRAQLKKQQNTLAISALNQSLLLDPEQPETLALRGSLLRKIGDQEGALVDYERALRLIPSNPVLAYEKGLVLLQLGRIDEAAPALEIAARKLSTHVTLDLLHASCAYTVGQYDEAAQSLREHLNPELEGDALERFEANLSDTAHYLYTLLSKRQEIERPELPSFSEAARLYARYAQGEATRKEVLDWAGRAGSPEKARQQICSTAYWLAQYEKMCGNPTAAKELLEIALKTGSTENPEWQFARWQEAKP